ncbi:MAG: type II toxin-antitoxin system RatA family toxin [bacterium]
MVYVKKSRVVSGDPRKVWQLINEVERYPEWMPGVVEARVVSRPRGRKSGLGRRQLLKTAMKLGQGEILQEVVAWEPPHRITWQHLKDIVDGKEIAQAKEIKTTLSMTYEDGKMTFRMIGSWEPAGASSDGMKKMMQRTMAKNFEEALLNLEKLIQQEAS